MSDIDDVVDDVVDTDEDGRSFGSPLSGNVDISDEELKTDNDDDDDDDYGDDVDDDVVSGTESEDNKAQKKLHKKKKKKHKQKTDDKDSYGDAVYGEDDGEDAYDEFEDNDEADDRDKDSDGDDYGGDYASDDYYSSDDEVSQSILLAQGKSRTYDPIARGRQKTLLKLAKTKKHRGRTHKRGGTRRNTDVQETKRTSRYHSGRRQKKIMNKLMRPPKRRTEEQFIQNSNVYTFKPKLIAKFQGNKVAAEAEKDPEKRFENTISRFEAKTKSVKDKLESRRGELDYNARNDKKVCDRCESVQSYDEWRGKKTQCSACEVGKYVVRRAVREKVCFICGKRQLHPSEKYCPNHPNEMYKARSITNNIGYHMISKSKSKKGTTTYRKPPAALSIVSNLEIMNQKPLPRKVVSFMDRMQVDAELRDIKKRRAMQVHKNVKESQIEKYCGINKTKQKQKVLNPYAANHSFLERVEQDIQMRREIAARKIQIKMADEDALLKNSAKRSQKLRSNYKYGSTRRNKADTITNSRAWARQTRKNRQNSKYRAVSRHDEDHTKQSRGAGDITIKSLEESKNANDAWSDSSVSM